MADDTNAAAQAGGDATLAPERTLLGGTQDTGGAAAGGGAPGGDAGSGDPGSASWPENWRELVAGEDQKELTRLQRISSPADLYKSYRQIERRLSDAAKAPSLPENASEAEITAYRKAVGIPDKPDGYGLAFPAEIAAGEADTAVLNAFQEFMHGRNVPPAAAKAAFEFYTKQLGQDRAAAAEAVREAQIENMAELRKEYPGREYKRNVGLATEFLGKHFEGSEQVLGEVLNARLPNGMKVGDYAPFVKGIIGMARSYADEEALIGGDGAGGGVGIDEEYTKLIDKSVTPGEKMSDRDHARLQELAAARVKREDRAGRGR